MARGRYRTDSASSRDSERSRGGSRSASPPAAAEGAEASPALAAAGAPPAVVNEPQAAAAAPAAAPAAAAAAVAVPRTPEDLQRQTDAADASEWKGLLITREQETTLWRELLALEACKVDAAKRLHGTAERLTRLRANDAKLRKERALQMECDARLRRQLDDVADKAKEEQAKKDAEATAAAASDDAAATTTAAAPPRRPRRVFGSADGAGAARGRRMFAGVLGVLERQRTALDADGHKRRVELQKTLDTQHLERQAAEQAREFAAEVASLDAVADELRAARSAVEGRLEACRREWVELQKQQRDFLLAGFLVTTAQPPVYYLPTRHTPETRAALASRRAAAVAGYSEFKTRFVSVVLPGLKECAQARRLPSVTGTRPAAAAAAAAASAASPAAATAEEGVEEGSAAPSAKRRRVSCEPEGEERGGGGEEGGEGEGGGAAAEEEGKEGVEEETGVDKDVAAAAASEGDASAQKEGVGAGEGKEEERMEE